MSGAGHPLGWGGIVRLGLVQTALGSIVVLTTSTLNRVMIVELALPALLPGALVALYYTVQLLRPRLGYGSDIGGRRTPWILGGMILLAVSGVGAASATALMGVNTPAGVVLAALAFVLIGVGVGAAGTSLLVLLAKRVDDRRRPAAATIVWLMMIVGFVLTTLVAGQFLDPFSPARLVAVSAAVSCIAVLVTLLALHGVEGSAASMPRQTVQEPFASAPPPPPFRKALAEVWAEPNARRFAIFVFVSMLGYSAQNLILEPFSGTVFGYTPGQSTQLSGVQNGGILLGMLLVAIAGGAVGRLRIGSMRTWMIGGCVASAAALLALATAGFVSPDWPLRVSVFLLGMALGTFAVAAIWSMMGLVNTGRAKREGVRMGLWGAAQAIAFGLGGLLGTAAIDLTRYLFESPVVSYATVFTAEALLFLVAGALATRIITGREQPLRMPLAVDGDGPLPSINQR
jgi:MFS transporter, BCD family, chlorophyll transporter